MEKVHYMNLFIRNYLIFTFTFFGRYWKSIILAHNLGARSSIFNYLMVQRQRINYEVSACLQPCKKGPAPCQPPMNMIMNNYYRVYISRIIYATALPAVWEREM